MLVDAKDGDNNNNIDPLVEGVAYKDPSEASNAMLMDTKDGDNDNNIDSLVEGVAYKDPSNPIEVGDTVTIFMGGAAICKRFLSVSMMQSMIILISHLSQEENLLRSK